MMCRVLVVVALLSVAACGGGGGPGGSPTTAAAVTSSGFAARGSVSVPLLLDSVDLEAPAVGDRCRAARGYGDVRAGAQVVVRDRAGVTLAVGVLDPGSLAVASEQDTAVTNARCVFGFAVAGVPAGLGLYAVHVGNVSRGDVTYSEDQLRAGVELTVG